MASFIKTPFTDIGGCVFTHQTSRRCQDFELRYVECVEAYGALMAVKKCADLHSDFNECAHMTKQLARVEAMKAERNRQYSAGERSKTNLYAKVPNPDVL